MNTSISVASRSCTNSPYKDQPILLNTILFFITASLYDNYNCIKDMIKDDVKSINKKKACITNNDNVTFNSYKRDDLTSYNVSGSFLDFLIDLLDTDYNANDIRDMIFYSQEYIYRDIMADLNNLYLFDKLVYYKIFLKCEDKDIDQMWGSCLMSMTNLECDNSDLVNTLNILSDSEVYDAILDIYNKYGPFISAINELNNRNSSYLELSHSSVDLLMLFRRIDVNKYRTTTESNKIFIKAAFSYIILMLSKYNIYSNNNDTFIKSIELAEEYIFTNTNMIKYEDKKDNPNYELFEIVKDAIINKKKIDFDMKLESILPINKIY